ncbi:MAG: TIGR00730 family Rossman fold protein [Bacteroidaceae bacterium]|nr:TIGR00730 family Rossman fold protein [Bacteroidaceae bacterium]
MSEIKRICIYCSSSTKIDDCYFRDARKLGQLMAAKGIAVINGAGKMGLMQASTDGCLEAGGEAIGIIPSFMIKEGWCHQGMTQIIETPDMHIRQQKMAEMSDAAIILPGGCGTLAELMELITWKQLGLYLKPIVILNTNGYYNPLIQTLLQAVEQNFMRQQHSAIWQVASTPEEALKLVLETPLWDTSIRRFAAI